VASSGAFATAARSATTSAPSGEQQAQAVQHAPQADPDEETQRVLRFLYS
jgi:hypothetical protein